MCWRSDRPDDARLARQVPLLWDVPFITIILLVAYRRGGRLLCLKQFLFEAPRDSCSYCFGKSPPKLKGTTNRIGTVDCVWEDLYGHQLSRSEESNRENGLLNERVLLTINEKDLTVNWRFLWVATTNGTAQLFGGVRVCVCVCEWLIRGKCYCFCFVATDDVELNAVGLVSTNETKWSSVRRIKCRKRVV